MSFVHLHTHTQYSLLDGSNRISEYVKCVKNMGMNAAAITDHGAMFGVIEFYKEAKKAGINPVIGCEVYVSPGSRFDREKAVGEDKYYHLILLAENNEGYDNLKNIVSIGYIDGFYYRPRVDYETLEKYREGIICLSACLAGQVPRLLAEGNYDEAKKVALKYRDCFGKDNYFLEMQDHGIPMQQNVNTYLMKLSKETGIPLVVTNDCHYTYAGDAESHDVLLCIQTGKVISDENRMRYEGGQFYVKSQEEMSALFPFAKDALYNTQKIADRCHVEIEFGNRKLPKFQVPEGYDSASYLRKICEEGLRKRYEDKRDKDWEEIKSKLDFELETINSMGFNDYFLIVWDFINYAKTKDIPVGPGRGSAAGSLVAYSTGITDIDPERFSLLFERFLNPERVSMPDIDIDFCINRRGMIIDYVVNKYGKDCVSQIITMGTLKARNAIRDVGRAMDMPYAFVSNIANMIPKELNITIKKALEKNPDFNKLYRENDDIHKLIDTALQLEGLPRNAGTHAAGVVITQNPIVEYVPLARVGDKKGDERALVTQFEKDTVEELGLLKMDFLGLRNLTIIDDTRKIIQKTTGEDIDLLNIPENDDAVFTLISSGKTEGVFQLESPGMMNFMKELRPESIEDIIAGIALYRPGPMQFIPQYIRGKRDKSKIIYECSRLEPILSATYGCIVYQEQVMQIVRDLAGYSLGRSDILRRAMSKKKADVMARERDIFVNGDPDTGVIGCVNNGISKEIANSIFDKMLDFAEYAFNKSHAASYAMITYQTAYLKLYYPLEFFAALLTSVLNNTEDVAKYIACARDMNIKIMPPDINSSEGSFTVKNGCIYYGMYAVKSVGASVIDSIITDRTANGSFKSLDDFIERILRLKKNGESGKITGVVNKRSIEALILAGALDCLEGNRRQKILIYEKLMDSVSKRIKDDISGQISLFDFAKDTKALSIPMPNVKEFDKQELLKNEKKVMGIYVSGHPLDEYRNIIKSKVTATSDMFKDRGLEDSAEETIEEMNFLSERAVYTIGGIINAVNIKYTKNNQPMAFLTLEDLNGSVEVIVFPNAYEKCRELLEVDRKVLISGRADIEADRDSKLICENMADFDNLPGKLWIQFPDSKSFADNKEDLIRQLKGYPGLDTVIIYIGDTKTRKKMGFTIKADEYLVKNLSNQYGNENVKLVK